MLHRRYLAAAIASVMTVAGLFASVPAAAKPYLQCVPFARAESGVEIRGNAKTWWSQAAGTYQRGEEPRKGAVMAFAGTRGMPMGHVAGVRIGRAVCRAGVWPEVWNSVVGVPL